MDDLISRLVAADGGSRVTDAEIAVAAGYDLPAPMGDAKAWLKLPTKDDQCEPGTYWLVQRSGMSLRSAPLFTALKDSAEKLVPLGWYSMVEPRFYIDGERVTYRAYCIRPRWQDWTPLEDWFDLTEAEAQTPANALSAAALRARGRAS